MASPETDAVNAMIALYRDQLSEEFGSFTTFELQAGRVCLVPDSATDRGDWQACYISAGRLMVDDIVPEILEGEEV